MRWTEWTRHTHQQREALKQDEVTLGDTPEAIVEWQALLDKMVGGDSDESDESFYSNVEDSWADSYGGGRELNGKTTLEK